MWYKELKKRKQYTIVESIEYRGLDTDLVDFELDSVSETSLIEELFKELDDGCKTILIQNIYQKLPMKTIAEINGLKNEQIARNKKYKCLKKLQGIISKSNRFRALINDIDL